MFTDSHGSSKAMKSIERKIKKHKPELIVCAGDITIFEHNLKSIMEHINSWKKQTLIVHGNHESSREMKKISKDLKFIKFIDKKHFRIDNLFFIGYGGGGFALTDKEFDRFAEKKIKQKKKKEKLILLTHGPPYGTAIDMIYEEHCGNKSYTKFIKKRKPLIAVSGHLHEDNNTRQIYKNNTLIINPGPNGTIIDTKKVENNILKLKKEDEK